MNAPKTARDMTVAEAARLLDEVGRTVARRAGFAPVQGERVRVTLERLVPLEEDQEPGSWECTVGAFGWSARVESGSLSGAVRSLRRLTGCDDE